MTTTTKMAILIFFTVITLVAAMAVSDWALSAASLSRRGGPAPRF